MNTPLQVSHKTGVRADPVGASLCILPFSAGQWCTSNRSLTDRHCCHFPAFSCIHLLKKHNSSCVSSKHIHAPASLFLSLPSLPCNSWVIFDQFIMKTCLVLNTNWQLKATVARFRVGILETAEYHHLHYETH